MTVPVPVPMLSEDEQAVRSIYTTCHPALLARPKHWYVAYPTLIVKERGVVMGFTSFSVIVASGFGATLYGNDLCVLPKYRGQGIGDTLHAARLSIGRSVGATLFMGITNKENKSMRRILETSGMHQCVPVGDDIMYMGPIGEV